MSCFGSLCFYRWHKKKTNYKTKTEYSQEYIKSPGRHRPDFFKYNIKQVFPVNPFKILLALSVYFLVSSFKCVELNLSFMKSLYKDFELENYLDLLFACTFVVRTNPKSYSINSILCASGCQCTYTTRYDRIKKCREHRLLYGQADQTS
jgi:hypothetical protein